VASMARNYEAVREALRLAGEAKLQSLDDAFQEHQAWFRQAAEELKVQAAECLPQAQEQPQRASRRRAAADKVRLHVKAPMSEVLHTELWTDLPAPSGCTGEPGAPATAQQQEEGRQGACAGKRGRGGA
jgi:hypothetical protein